jgi:predicted ATPase
MDGAFSAMEATHERYAEPELHRLRGIVLERRGADSAAVEACYRRALKAARQRGAKAWELRAAVSLARCLHAQGLGKDARAELAGAISGLAPLSEGRDFADALQQLQLLPA